jgi:hypothetical protein
MTCQLLLKIGLKEKKTNWLPNSLHFTKLPYTLLTFTASICSTASSELHGTLWATLHPTELSGAAFQWSLPHPSELHCTFLNYAAPSAQCRTLLSHGALYWVTLHLTELRCSHSAALHPIELHPTKLCWTLLSYAASYWAMVHPAELRWTLHRLLAHPNWATLPPTELRCALPSYAAP